MTKKRPYPRAYFPEEYHYSSPELRELSAEMSEQFPELPVGTLSFCSSEQLKITLSKYRDGSSDIYCSYPYGKFYIDRSYPILDQFKSEVYATENPAIIEFYEATIAAAVSKLKPGKEA